MVSRAVGRGRKEQSQGPSSVASHGIEGGGSGQKTPQESKSFLKSSWRKTAFLESIQRVRHRWVDGKIFLVNPSADYAEKEPIMPKYIPINCQKCDHRSETEWKALEEEEVKLLNEVKICNTYQPGQVIFYQGNPSLGLYCIEEGTVSLRKLDEHGNSIVVRLYHGGQTLGYRAFFSGGPYSASAEAVTLCRICFVDRASVNHLLQHNPRLGFGFLTHLANDLKQAEEERLQAATLSVRARLAHFLLLLREHYGSSDENGDLSIAIPLSRQDLASMLSIRPETLSRTIKLLEKDGVALFDRQIVRIPDLDSLLDEVERLDT